MTKLNMELDAKEEKQLQLLKDEYGIKQATELIRFLLRKEAKTLSVPSQ